MLRFVTAGESHGETLVATLSGMPAGVPVDLGRINRDLWRRQQGFGRGGRMKIETDKAQIVSGVRHGRTIGSPIAILLQNRDWKNWTETLPVEDYEGSSEHARPVNVLARDMPTWPVRSSTTIPRRATSWNVPAPARPPPV